MKKLAIITALLVIGALGWVAATQMLGTQVEQRYFSFLRKHPNWGPVTLSEAGYQRGFLSSRAETVAQIAVGEDETLRLHFVHTLRHGPLPAWRTPDGEIRLEPMLALIETRLADIESSGNAEDLLVSIPELKKAYAFTLFGLSGGGMARAYIPALQTAVEEGDGTVDWQGLAAQAEFTQGLSTLEGFFTLPGFRLDSAEGYIHLGKTTGDFDLYQAFPDVFLGESAMRVEEISADSAADDGKRGPVVISRIEMTADSRRQEGKVSFDQTLGIAGITADGSEYGPGVMEISLRGLDGMALSRIESEMQKLQEDLAGLSPEEIAGRILPAYLQLWVELLQGEPELEVRRLHFATPQGDIDGRALLRFEGSNTSAASPGQWLQALQADARLEIAEELLIHILTADLRRKMLAAREREEFPPFSDAEIDKLAREQAAKQVETLLRQKLLVRRNGELAVQAKLEDNKLLLNEHPIPLQ